MNQIISFLSIVNDKLVVFIAVILLMCQCTVHNNENANKVDEGSKKEYCNSLWSIRDIDSLLNILERFVEEKDVMSQMLIHKQIGVRQRESARLSDAINTHQKGLDMAIKLNDTVEIVQAMNNLGTNFRRIGAHDEASQYHYQALHMAEAWSGLHTQTGIKNRIMALNGIGNISLMLGYYDDAENNFREALKYEMELKSPIGQSINYANIGAIFEIREQIDSAYIYYQKSLEQNIIANSDMGIGLCLIHIGELYEKVEKYELAIAEYKKAYELMDQISDKWHWLQACLSIARIHLITNNNTEFKHYIELAQESAEEIKSPEHLAEIYLLKHEFNIKQGNYNLALNNYKQHKVMKDSIQGQQMVNRYMEIRLGHEQNKNLLRIQEVEATSKMKQQKKQLYIYIGSAEKV